MPAQLGTLGEPRIWSHVAQEQLRAVRYRFLMLLAGRVDIPAGTTALLFDLDGVLVDSLSLDYEIVNRLIEEELGAVAEVPQSLIRKNFARSIPEFWQSISEETGLGLFSDAISRLSEKHVIHRFQTPMTLHVGIPEIIDAARSEGIAIGVVSNNPQAEISAILERVSLFADVIVGNDEPDLRPKPAQDTYVAAVNRLDRQPDLCVAIEDSLLGVEAASAAGCHTITVATGADSFEELADSPYTSRCYTSFAPCYVSLGRDGVASTFLNSPNGFVSRVIEHIAWQLGCSIDLSWTNDDWRSLGCALGQQVRKLSIRREAASAIGMIDGGSAEIVITEAQSGGAEATAAEQVDLDCFLGSRSAQLSTGAPLLEILKGLGEGGGLDIRVRVAAFGDPLHAWEGVFRGVGIVLDKMFNEKPREGDRTSGPYLKGRRS